MLRGTALPENTIKKLIQAYTLKIETIKHEHPKVDLHHSRCRYMCVLNILSGPVARELPFFKTKTNRGVSQFTA